MATRTTPLRRVSRGSLSASIRSGAMLGGDATPLSCLQDALSDLCEETAVLQSNLESVGGIQESLGTFNESFAMFLYGLKMNAFCVEWPEAPQEENFARAGERGNQLREQEQLQGQLYAGGYGASSASPARGATGLGGGTNLGDQTYLTADDDTSFGPPTPKAAVKPAASGAKAGAAAGGLKPALKKPAAGTAAAKGAKAKITLALKKKREGIAAGIIDTLPLEYRGADPKPRALAEGVIMALLAAGSNGARIADIVQLPDLPQAKVNKTLIALVAAKHVVKSSNNGVVYALDPARHG